MKITGWVFTAMMATTTALTAPATATVSVRLGDEAMDEARWAPLLDGKRLGLVTNPSGVDSRLTATVDKLYLRGGGSRLTALFAPEHGLRGAQGAGEDVKDGRDPATSVPVYSLHGTAPDGKARHKPTTASLAKVDVLLYDIQDIGNRSYTYAGTMEKCMEAAADKGIPFVVLDRPNPMGGILTDGDVSPEGRESLVCWAPVPYIYGLTCGEMARWMNDNSMTTGTDGKRRRGIGCDLTVIPMKGWKRSMTWGDTGLPWIPTSTHMPRWESCWHIAATGMLGELLSVNVGVGYPAPFEYVGAPFLDGVALASDLDGRSRPGMRFRPVQFRPYYTTFEGEMCGGTHLMFTDLRSARPVEAGLHLMDAIQRQVPQEDVFRTESRRKSDKSRGKSFDGVAGGPELRAALVAGKPVAEILAGWTTRRAAWNEAAEKYRLYE